MNKDTLTSLFQTWIEGECPYELVCDALEEFGILADEEIELLNDTPRHLLRKFHPCSPMTKSHCGLTTWLNMQGLEIRGCIDQLLPSERTLGTNLMRARNHSTQEWDRYLERNSYLYELVNHIPVG